MATKAEYRALLIGEVGKRYVLGTPSPHTRWPAPAYDCSGLGIAALNKIGYVLGDTTAAGLWNLSEPVAAGDEQAGDMVFLANHSGRKAPPGYRYGIGHVAYITAKLSTGDREIVEARSSTAGVVRTTLSFWKSRSYYAGVRRLKKRIVWDDTAPVPPVSTFPDELTVDGDIGVLTADAWRWALGMPRTGRGVDVALRRAVQRWLGVTDDGDWGPATVKALQAWVDTPRDGQWGPDTSKRVQRWMNALIVAAQAPTAGDARVFSANLQSYDGHADAGEQAKLVWSMGTLGFLSETNRAKRDAIKRGSWWVVAHSRGSVALAFDLATWTPGRPSQVREKWFGTGFGHGALMLPVTHDATNLTVDAEALHIRPKSVASPAGKKADTKLALQLPTRPLVLIGGDWAQNRPSTPGYRRLSDWPDTMDKPGDQSCDGVAGRGFTATKKGLKNPGSLSDHLYPWVVVIKEGSDL